MPSAFHPFPVLHSPRLTLRRILLTDAPEIFIIRSSPNEFVNYEKAKTVADAEAFIKRINALVTRGETVNWAITLNDTGKLIGVIIFWNFADDRLTAEIGYELMIPYHGQGIMHEAATCVLNYGFNTLRLQQVEAYTIPNHSRSVNLLHKFNFKPGPTQPDDTPEVIYVLSAEDYFSSL